MDWLKLVHRPAESSLPAFKTGDEIRVWYKIKEQEKERLGQFEGTVIRCRGSGPARTFTVRRVTYGEGVERIFPFDAKTIARVELLRQGKVHRARLFYLRRKVGKTRIASADDAGVTKTGTPGPTSGPQAESVAPKSERAASVESPVAPS